MKGICRQRQHNQHLKHRHTQNGRDVGVEKADVQYEFWGSVPKGKGRQ